MGATPFTEPDHYDVSLGGRRCDIKSFLISYREQIAEMEHNPQILLNAPALVPSDQNAAEGHRSSDIYLFAFLSGLVTILQNDIQQVIASDEPHYFVHIMPDSWTRPQKWTPLGALIFKSDSEEPQVIEIGGQDSGREMRSLKVEIPPRTRVTLDEGFHSLTYVHITNMPNARIGMYSPTSKQTHIVGLSDWGNIWVYGMDILLAGYLTREEFNRRASFLREGARVFQYDHTRTKNLAVNVCDLKPLSELFEQVKASTPPGTAMQHLRNGGLSG
jgi:hypothetical protein